MEEFVSAGPFWAWQAAYTGMAVIAAIAFHALLVFSFRRVKLTPKLEALVLQRLRKPVFWLLIGMALILVQPALQLTDTALVIWSRLAGLLVPATIGWLAVAMVGLASDLAKSHLDMDAADNLAARRRRTRLDILNRIAVFIVVLTTFCFMLISIPSIRAIGVTLIASAGLAALAIGAAAQPVLKNVIAGLQMAFTEPIRIDDVVVIDGEWGRIEEIRLTYVVIKLWDERRLIVPVARFLEGSFQNWTRQTSATVGSVHWYLDPSADIRRLRIRLLELVHANPLWDGRFCNLQVTGTKPESIEVRALMTARDASAAFDLRCEIREAMLQYICKEMPSSMVRYRGAIEVAAHAAA